jgi:hypothetical protein
LPRVAGAAVSPQATGVRGADQENAQVLRRRARSEEAHAVDNLKSQGRSRLASTPVRPQVNVTELSAAGKQADLESERLRLKALAAKSVVELAREKTPPPPPPPPTPKQ